MIEKTKMKRKRKVNKIYREREEKKRKEKKTSSRGKRRSCPGPGRKRIEEGSLRKVGFECLSFQLIYLFPTLCLRVSFGQYNFGSKRVLTCKTIEKAKTAQPNLERGREKKKQQKVL